MTKIELFNAKSAGVALEDGVTFECKDAGIYKDTDKDGNEVDAVAFVATDGTVYTGIGAGLIRAVDDLLDIIADMGGAVTVKCNVIKTKSDRDFKTLSIIE